MKERNWHLVCV